MSARLSEVQVLQETVFVEQSTTCERRERIAMRGLRIGVILQSQPSRAGVTHYWERARPAATAQIQESTRTKHQSRA